MKNNGMVPWVRYEYVHRSSIFCPDCHKIMEPVNKYGIMSKLICKDCNIVIKPKLSDLRRVGGEFKMATFEGKAIDMTRDTNNTVKFSTVDYFPKLIKVEYGDTKFIVDRDDMKAMLKELQLVKEDD